MTKRMAIIGTAQSWRLTPWTDPGLELWSLNDAYRIPGFKRADRWFDLHPHDHFWFVPEGAKSVNAKEIPVGHYVRPAGYLDWLKKLSIPLYLQLEPTEGFGPLAKRFPKEEIEAHFGRYFTSTPAWMLALAVMEGYSEIHIYGIHLATENEYIEQRPNFEYLIGRVLGKGKVTQTVVNGVRHYETADGHIALPADSPVLQSDFQYAYQTRPRAILVPLQVELHELQIKREKLMKQLITRKWWEPASSTQAELRYVNAAIADAQHALQRAQFQLGA